MGFINKESDHFFFVEFDSIVKAKDEQGNEVMKFKGVASTGDEDSQGEILDPNGFDFKPFLEKGYINFHHQANKDPLANIGEPTKAFIKDNQFHIEGDLYNDNPLAVKVYQMAQILKKNSKTRRLGLSIEGKAVEHDPNNPKKITKSIITGCAITHSPINTNTIMDIVKGQQNDSPPLFNDSDFSEFSIEKSEKKNEVEDDENIFEIEDGENSLVVKKGYKVVLKKGKKKGIIEKDLTTDSGRPMIKESLESEIKNLTDSGTTGKKMIKSENLPDIIKSDFPELSDSDVEEITILVKTKNNKETNMSKIISQDVLTKAYEALGLTQEAAKAVETVAEKVVETVEVVDEKPVVLQEETKELEVVENAPALDLDLIKGEIQKSMLSLGSDLGDKFSSVATILKGFSEQFSALERRLEDYEMQPTGNRKSVERVADNLKVIEKGFNNGALAADKVDENTISKGTPQGKNKILGLFEKAIHEGGDKSETLIDRLISFESMGSIDNETVAFLNDKFKVNIVQ